MTYSFKFLINIVLKTFHFLIGKIGADRDYLCWGQILHTPTFTLCTLFSTMIFLIFFFLFEINDRNLCYFWEKHSELTIFDIIMICRNESVSWLKKKEGARSPLLEPYIYICIHIVCFPTFLHFYVHIEQRDWEKAIEYSSYMSPLCSQDFCYYFFFIK